MRIDLHGTDLQYGHIDAGKRAAEGDAVGVCNAADGDRALAVQRDVACCGCAQGALHHSCTGTQGNVGGGVNLTRVAQAQAEHACGACDAVYVHALHLRNCGAAFGQRDGGCLDAVDREALLGDVGSGEHAQEGNHKALLARVAGEASVKAHVNVCLCRGKKRSVCSLDGGNVFRRVTRNPMTGLARAAGCRAFGLNSNQLQGLPSKASACHQGNFCACQHDAELRAVDLPERGVDGGVDLQGCRATGNHASGVSLAQIA